VVRKKHECNGCWTGGYRAWELASEIAQKRGDLERARGWLVAARDRCGSRYRRAIREREALTPSEAALELHNKIIKAIETEFKKEARRLDKKIKAFG
jgi:hypothetical protein